MDVIKVNAEVMKDLLLSNICCTESNERKLLEMACYKVMKKATVEGLFYPEKYKKLWSNVFVITKKNKRYLDYKYDFEHFNPLGDYSYEFLAESDEEYAVIFVKKEKEE